METVTWAADNYLVMKVAVSLYVSIAIWFFIKYYKYRKAIMSYKCGKCGVKFNSQAQAKCARCKGLPEPTRTPPMPKVAMPKPYAEAYARPVPTTQINGATGDPD